MRPEHSDLSSDLGVTWLKSLTLMSLNCNRKSTVTSLWSLTSAYALLFVNKTSRLASPTRARLSYGKGGCASRFGAQRTAQKDV